MNIWPAFELFEQLLKEFGDHLTAARNDVVNAALGREVQIAMVGFSLFCPLVRWTNDHTDFIRQRIEGDYTIEKLEWFEEYAESVMMFASLSFGAIMGKIDSGELNNADFLYGQALLPAFLSMESEEIYRIYELQIPDMSA